MKRIGSEIILIRLLLFVCRYIQGRSYKCFIFLSGDVPLFSHGLKNLVSLFETGFGMSYRLIN